MNPSEKAPGKYVFKNGTITKTASKTPTKPIRPNDLRAISIWQGEMFSALRKNRKSCIDRERRRSILLAISIETLHFGLIPTGRDVDTTAGRIERSGIESFINTEHSVTSKEHTCD
jgi:hypothetical protein